MENSEKKIQSPDRKIHLAALANVLGIIVIYFYYRYLNPDPRTITFWRSNITANILFFVLAALPFFIIGFLNKVQRSSIAKIVSKERATWSSEEISQLLDYLLQIPKQYFFFSFFAWTFEGILWGVLSWILERGTFFSSFFSTVLGCTAAGAVAALFSFIIADKMTRQEVIKLFPHLEYLNRPVNFSLIKVTLLILCVVGLMPVLLIGFLSFLHAEHAILTQDLARLSILRNTNISIFVLSVFLTVMAIGWITRNISRPLVNMAELMKKVSTGDFSARMPITTDDEIGYVSGGLNKMIMELSVLYQSLELKVKERTEKLNIALSEVEQSNMKIMDSISYSQKIQHSLLPNVDAIQQFLPQSFFLWMPRDVVGGDIYYAESFDTGFMIAVIDCTGHGIPGALMTMATASSLRRITMDEGCLNPADILSRLNSIIKTSLHQDTDHATSDDGLDASVCFFNTTEKNLTFAGARLPLVYIKNGEVVTVKGDRHSIGYKKSDINFKFTNRQIDLEDGMAFYLFTDGIIDQLGGKKRIPFGKKRFYDLLLGIQSNSFEEQQNKISGAFEEYKGDNETQDDLTVIGFRV